MIALFVQVYGFNAFFNPAAYPTADGHIPFRLFLAMFQQIDHLEGLTQVTISQAVALGYSMARAPKGPGGSKVRTNMRKLLRRAFPEEK